MKLWKKIVLIAVISVISLLALVILALSIAKPIVYSEYTENKEIVCKIPGLAEGYVPQGVCYVESKEAYIFSGYNEENVAIYVVKDGNVAEIISINADGSRTESHGGGVATAGNYVYVTNEETVLVYNLSKLMDAKDGEEVEVLEELDIGVASACVFTDDEYIYFTEFYNGNQYVTDPSHEYTTPAGDNHHAFVMAYKLDEYGMFNPDNPQFVISVANMVQGFMKHGDTYAISTSWGVNSSHLTFYKGIKDSGTTFSISGKEIPLYYLDSTSVSKVVPMPAFSEDLDVVDGRVIVSFESACNKYIIGKFFFANDIVMLDFSK